MFRKRIFLRRILSPEYISLCFIYQNWLAEPLLDAKKTGKAIKSNFSYKGDGQRKRRLEIDIKCESLLYSLHNPSKVFKSTRYEVRVLSSTLGQPRSFYLCEFGKQLHLPLLQVLHLQVRVIKVFLSLGYYDDQVS